MKERLNLTIDGELLDAMKAYAASKEMSVSELVENYFRSVTRPVQRRNILDLVDELEAPAPDESADLAGSFGRRAGGMESPGPDADLKVIYYKEQGNKHGF